MINYGSDNKIDKVTKKAMINHGNDNKIDKVTTVVKQTSTVIYKSWSFGCSWRVVPDAAPATPPPTRSVTRLCQSQRGGDDEVCGHESVERRRQKLPVEQLLVTRDAVGGGRWGACERVGGSFKMGGGEQRAYVGAVVPAQASFTRRLE